MRSPARDGDPDEQREQQDGNEDDQEYRHDCLPQESDDHPQVDLPVTANLQTRAAPIVAATKELIGLASARTRAPSGTSPAMRPPALRVLDAILSKGEKIGRAHVELQSLMRTSYDDFCLNKKRRSTL